MSFYGYIELQRCTVITDSALAVMAVTVQCQCSAAVFVHCSRPCVRKQTNTLADLCALDASKTSKIPKLPKITILKVKFVQN